MPAIVRGHEEHNNSYRVLVVCFLALIAQTHALPLNEEPATIVRATDNPHILDERRGIVFVPPFGGVQLEAMKKDREIVHAWDVLCDRDTLGQWVPEWLPPSSWTQLVKMQCLIENLALPPPAGVTVRFRDAYEASMYLDDTDHISMHSIVWGHWAELLIANGWEKEKTLFAFAMDWRLGPQSFYKPVDGAFARFKSLVEKAVASSGGAVTLLSASMGGPFVALFCADYVTEEWKAANIFSFVSISGVYGGSTSPLNTLLSGRWGDLLPTFLLSTARDAARTIPALPWLLPAASVFGPDRVWMRTATRNFTAADLASPLREAGCAAAADEWAHVAHLSGLRLAPNVSTVCIYGVDIDTRETLVWNDDDLTRSYDFTTLASGDGTVLRESLEACSQWAAVQKMPVQTITIPGVQHTQFLTHEPTMQRFLKLMTETKIEKRQKREKEY